MKYLKVGRKKIPIVYKEDMPSNYFGMVLSEPESRIEVNARIKGKRAVYETLFHEGIHLIDGEYGIGLSEKKVRVLETTLIDLLRNNPDLVKELMK